MNIFVLDSSPKEAAYKLHKGHLNKMLIESCQMLVTTLYQLHYEDIPRKLNGSLYRPAYINHPCTIWTRTSPYNYAWLCSHADTLLNRCREIYGTKFINSAHCLEQCIRVTVDPNWYKLAWPVSDTLTVFANCTPYKDKPQEELTQEEVIQLYQKYYAEEKWHIEQ